MSEATRVSDAPGPVARRLLGIIAWRIPKVLRARAATLIAYVLAGLGLVLAFAL